MKKHVFLKTLLSSLMAISTISASAVPVIAEEAETETEVVEIAEATEVTEDEVVEVSEEETEDEEIDVDLEVEPEEEEEEGAIGTGSIAFESSADEVAVTADAPAGAFPEGTTMTAETVTDTAVLDLIKDAVGEDATILAAVDITFTSEGETVQPDEAVKIAFAASDIAYSENLKVVHVDDKGEELTATVLDQELIETEDGGVAFDADSFSVYAVVGSGSGVDEARATVNFYRTATDAEPIATVYVKNKDTLEQLEHIVYDPGAGEVQSGQLFKGWTDTPTYTTTTTAKTVEDIRKELEEKEIKEGDVYNYYAMVFNVYDITYIGDKPNVALGNDIVLVPLAESSATYTVNQAYTAAEGHNFEGWTASAGGMNIDGWENDKVYPNGTSITIHGSVTFSVNAPEGHWLIFSNGGVKNATYVAPQFVKSGEGTKKPAQAEDSNMQCLGYEFGGWYADAACTQPFEFGNTISDNTTVYAKWTQISKADYIVIIWKQNVAGDGYDFEKVVSITDGSVNQTPNVVSGTAGNATANVNGTNCSWTGFHYQSTDQASKKISAEGNTVVNVYFDRNTITFNFNIYDYTYTPTTSNNGTQYGLVDGQYVELTRHNGGSVFNPSYYWTYNDGWVSEGPRYTGTRYTRSNNRNWHLYKTMTGLYGSTLAENDYTWPTEYDWYETGGNNGNTSGTRTTFLDAFIPTSNNTTVNFYGSTPAGSNHIYFYKQNADGNGYTLANTVNTNANGFNLSDKYNGFKCVAWNTSNNTSTWTQVGDLMNQSGNYYYDANPSESGYQTASIGTNGLHIYFDRLSYSINFMDGAYVDGNGNPMDEVSRGQLHEVNNLTYGTSLTSYNKDGDDYYSPESAISGYVFEGWYIDESCTHEYTFTTLPDGGVTVYAKWRQIQYRVFLHPNVPRTDTTLSWGDESATEKQAMNFRISYGGLVSTPDGTRTGYEMIGWYTDDGTFSNLFNDEITALTEATVNTPYDKTVDMTDDMDKYGLIVEGTGTNSDLTGNNGSDRFWITKKLDLYANWRSVLDGADGIGVIYNKGVGSTAPTDTLLYLDQATAIAQSAATTDNATLQFLHWVVQRWDGEKYVDTDTLVYPGDGFKVLKANAQVTPAGTDEDGKPKYNYTVQLRAEFGPKSIAKDTHIDWYSNTIDTTGTALNSTVQVKTGYTTEDTTSGKVYKNTGLQINQAVEIPPYDLYKHDGYKFLGWAKVDETKDEGGNTVVGEATKDKLFLEYRDGAYYAKSSPTATTFDLQVTHVAADEVEPYQDLVALWVGQYTIMFSSDLRKQTYDVDDKTVTDLQSLVADTHLYGGYYHYDTVEDDLVAYTATTGQENYWKERVAYTTPWADLTPEAGKTYFVKEVPSHYLSTYLQYYYNNRYGKFLMDMYLVTAIDDLRYKEIGFARSNSTDVTSAALTLLPTKVAKVYDSVYFKSSIENMLVKAGGDSNKDNVSLTKKSDAVGYVANLNVIGLAHGMDEGVWYPLEKSFSGLKFNYIPYYVTLDGVPVVGKNLRNVSVGLGYVSDLNTSDTTNFAVADIVVSTTGGE